MVEPRIVGIILKNLNHHVVVNCMAKIKSKKLRSGDVFLIPISEDEFVLGQILEPGTEFYMCVFNTKFNNPELCNVESIIQAGILFIGRTSDALIYHGEWKYVGNYGVVESYPRPNSVVNTSQGLVLRSFDRDPIRSANIDDFNFYGYEKSVHPLSFVNAAKEFFEIAIAEKDFRHLRLEDAKRRETIISI